MTVSACWVWNPVCHVTRTYIEGFEDRIWKSIIVLSTAEIMDGEEEDILTSLNDLYSQQNKIRWISSVRMILKGLLTCMRDII
jgi:hypothetical protein